VADGSLTDIPAAALRVAAAASAAGIPIDIRVMADDTRTAEQAAAACCCEVGQIVKSLVFRTADGAAVLLLVSGRHRVDEAVAEREIGSAIERPNAAFVRAQTGFAIGGIPPFGHANRLPTYIDRYLLGYVEVFAAAGTPNTLFAIAPASLLQATEAKVIEVSTVSD
jgi:prolyl-tRNA editing enzyme YbaK/EbsC (Cys-tRNA(Pro) deacylase)